MMIRAMPAAVGGSIAASAISSATMPHHTTTADNSLRRQRPKPRYTKKNSTSEPAMIASAPARNT